MGFLDHAFPRCFVCGPRRVPGDGLCIFPGAIESGSLVAAPWIPGSLLVNNDGTVGPEFLWAALDCTGGFAVFPLPQGRAILLGELSASLLDSVCSGEQCVVIGWNLGVDGRKRFAGSAVFGQDAQLGASARATWIEVARSTYAGS